MKVGSLFSGIGGIELGLERAGMTVLWQVEQDEYATRVLERHWPHAKRHRDVRHVGRHNLEPVDLICGGFPCQPHSLAGKRKASEDERDLWAEFARIICELKPRWVLAENVPGLLSSESGRFFGRILRDLAESGYDAEWDCLPASAFNAPHQRDRVFLVAYAHGERGRLEPGRRLREDRPDPSVAFHDGPERTLADPERSERRPHDPRGERLAREAALPQRKKSSGGLGKRRPDVPNAKAVQREKIFRHEPDRILPENVSDASSDGREPRGEGDAPEGPERREPDRGGLEGSLAHANGRGHEDTFPLPGRGESEPRGGGADVEDAQGERLEGWADGGEGIEEEANRLFFAGSSEPGRERSHPAWWDFEPDVGGSLDGLPSGLDGNRGGLREKKAEEEIKNAWKETCRSAGEVLRYLRDTPAAETLQQATRGFDSLSAEEILFAFLREYEAGGRLPRMLLESEATPEDILREMRRHRVASRPSLRRGSLEQFFRKYPNALRTLSQLVASRGETPWDCPLWESGIPRVTGRVPNRIHRLRGLGNAVVPQVAEWIGHRIMEAEREATWERAKGAAKK